MIFIELGAAVVGLALLARLANRWGVSAIPFYLLSGLAFGNGGLLPLPFSHDFVHVGAEIGVVLLLFMLGLEYTGRELLKGLRSAWFSGVIDLILNFMPGLVAGLLFGWGPLAAVLLGGVTYVSTSGIAARVLEEFRMLGNPETPAVLSILVLEDLTMALFLPIVAVLLIGQGIGAAALSVLAALAAVGGVLFLAVRHGPTIGRLFAHESDEVIVLSLFGAILLVAGIAQRIHVSTAIGAFLVGIALSGPIVEHARRLIGPLRDLFAAVFFFFFGLQIDPSTLPAALPWALALGIVTAITKLVTGRWAAGARVAPSARWRAGAALVARGEFSIVIAGLGVDAGLAPALRPFSAAYVLFLAVAGPLLVRVMASRSAPTEAPDR
jgi:CPA2 family monovalent cation:H+ antiporter-2